MRKAFVEALCSIAKRDPRVYLLTGDLGYSVLEPFIKQFPDRFVNMGVSEQNMTSVAAGLALSGKVALTYSIANFPTLRCLEQVRNDVCYHKANVKIVSVGGGMAYGSLGYTHYALEDLAVMKTLPGMTVIAPGDPAETRLATEAMMKMNGPCYLRLGKAGEPTVHSQMPKNFKIGKALVLRQGRRLCLMSTGGMLKTAMELAERMEKIGISAAVLSFHTLKPLDRKAIAFWSGLTKHVVTLEEHTSEGGLADAVSRCVLETGNNAIRFLSFATPDHLLTHVGTQDYLKQQAGLSPDKIFQGIKKWLSK